MTYPAEGGFNSVAAAEAGLRLLRCAAELRRLLAEDRLSAQVPEEIERMASALEQGFNSGLVTLCIVDYDGPPERTEWLLTEHLEGRNPGVTDVGSIPPGVEPPRDRPWPEGVDLQVPHEHQRAGTVDFDPNVRAAFHAGPQPPMDRSRASTDQTARLQRYVQAVRVLGACTAFHRAQAQAVGRSDLYESVAYPLAGELYAILGWVQERDEPEEPAETPLVHALGVHMTDLADLMVSWGYVQSSDLERDWAITWERYLAVYPHMAPVMTAHARELYGSDTLAWIEDRSAAAPGEDAESRSQPLLEPSQREYSMIYDGKEDFVIALVYWNHPSKGTVARDGGEWLPMDDIQLESINMKMIDNVTEGAIALVDQADTARTDLTRADVMPFVIPRKSHSESI